MPASFTTEQKSVGALLATAATFTVPAFQRPFSWETTEVGQLISEPLEAALDTDPSDQDELFLGTILLLDRGGAAGDVPGMADLIDGLQRLVTLTILLCVLRDRGTPGPGGEDLDRYIVARPKAGEEPARYRLTLRGSDAAYLTAICQERGATLAEPALEAPSDAAERLLDAREALIAEVGGRSPEECRRLAEVVLQRCTLVTITAHNLDRAHRLFTVLNYRGKPLSRHDILRAELLGRAPPADEPRCIRILDDLERRLGDRLENLFSHVRAIYGPAKGQIISDVLAVAERQGNGVPTFLETTVEPLGRALDLTDRPQHWQDKQVRTSLDYLGLLRSHDWVPPAMLWIARYGDDPARLGPLLARLDRMAYGLLLYGLGNDKRTARYRALVEAIRDRRPEKDVLRASELSADEQRAVLNSITRDPYKRGPQICKLVLLRINDWLAGEVTGLSGSDLTVEHILPLQPGVNSIWRKDFADALEREQLTRSIGNLALMRKGPNEKARNKDFMLKCQIIRDEQAMQSIALNADIAAASGWKPKQIRDREARIAALVRARWSLDGGARTGVSEEQA